LQRQEKTLIFFSCGLGFFFSLLLDKGLVTEGNRVAVTGGGAYKYEKILQETLNVILIKQEEMECLIAGLTFFIERRNEVFFYDVKEKRRVPYYLVNKLWL
jgi:pantothenate kinase